MSKEVQLSRKISYLLRHNPEDLDMCKEGWVRVNDLLFKLQIPLLLLEDIVKNNDKKRFAFSENGVYIRASQGHNDKLKLDIKFKEVQFPTTYYHGTVDFNMQSIMKDGLKPGNRSHVHLSKDKATAINVGGRHGDTIVVLQVDGIQMKKDGLKIYISDNGVILVDNAPAKYLKIV
jgi:putative RNA 2'-phosphotransferase